MDNKLFTPGPLNTKLSVKEAMLHDMGSRDNEFLEAIKTAGFTPTYADAKRTQQIVSSLSGLFSKYARDLRDAAAKTQ